MQTAHAACRVIGDADDIWQSVPVAMSKPLESHSFINQETHRLAEARFHQLCSRGNTFAYNDGAKCLMTEFGSEKCCSTTSHTHTPTKSIAYESCYAPLTVSVSQNSYAQLFTETGEHVSPKKHHISTLTCNNRFGSPTVCSKTYDIDSFPHSVPVKKRKPRKQKYESLRPSHKEDYEFIEVMYPVTPEETKKSVSTEKLASKAKKMLGMPDYELNEVCSPYEVLSTSATAVTSQEQRTETQSTLSDVPCSRIAPSQRTPKKLEARRLSIKEKLSKSGKDLQFTIEEEFDIHDRAEAFVMGIMPDTTFYQTTNSAVKLDKENINPAHCIKDPCHTRHYIMSPYKRRRRRNYGSVPCLFVKRKSSTDLRSEPYDNSHVLPEGTKLMKPPNKLVELVAQTLDESPDGLLQVQQVYTALMNKYPYFRFMDRTSTNSWRSSIRHALYQKWFRKVKFTNDLINCKGCFWAINRKCTPREWTMPGQTPTTAPDCATRRLSMGSRGLQMKAHHDENARAVRSILTHDECLENTGDLKYYEGIRAPTYTYCNQETRRKSDPVLANSSSLICERNSQEHLHQNVKTEVTESHQVVSWEQQSGESSSMYLGTWTPSWEEYHQSLAFQPPLMASSYYIPQQYVDGSHYGEGVPYYYPQTEQGYPYTEHW